MFIVLKNSQGLKKEGYKSGVLTAMLSEEFIWNWRGWQDKQITRKAGGG